MDEPTWPYTTERLYEYFWEPSYIAQQKSLTPWWKAFVDPDLNPAISAYAISSARSTALSQIRGTNFNALQFAAELRDTARTVQQLVGVVVGYRKWLNGLLIGLGYTGPVDYRSARAFQEQVKRRGGYLSHTARDGRRFFDAIGRDIARHRRYYRRQAMNKRRRVPARVASAYLWYIYGVMPIIRDIHQILDALQSASAEPLHRVFVRFPDPDFGIGKGFLTLTDDWDFRGKAEQGVNVGLTFTIRDPEVFELWRYGLLNPLAALWEVSPLSFIADWFTGIGSFLSALDSSIALRVTTGYETHWLDLELEAGHRTYVPKAALRQRVVSGSVWKWQQISQKAFRRYDNFLPPIPIVYLRADLNLSKLVSMLAIATSAFIR